MNLTALIARLTELEGKALRAPWQTEGGMNMYVFTKDNDVMLAQMRGFGAGVTDEQASANAQLIAEMRSALPTLLEALAIQREALEEIKENANGYQCSSCVNAYGTALMAIERVDALASKEGAK